MNACMAPNGRTKTAEGGNEVVKSESKRKRRREKDTRELPRQDFHFLMLSEMAAEKRLPVQRCSFLSASFSNWPISQTDSGVALFPPSFKCQWKARREANKKWAIAERASGNEQKSAHLNLGRSDGECSMKGRPRLDLSFRSPASP